ncbi:MAG: hypothetical protein E6Q83_16800 [Thiothrix sp.]|nr:MAG: hypothetical protein E6Q83_16800 [Thiothrix sp.]
MRLFIDAHLPRKLALQLKAAGYDVRHTLSLSQGNRTTDQDINKLSISEQRIVVTKDSDFVDSFWLQDQPWKLLLISTGNIRNEELLTLMLKNLDKLEQAFNDARFIELTRESLIVHI